MDSKKERKKRQGHAERKKKNVKMRMKNEECQRKGFDKVSESTDAGDREYYETDIEHGWVVKYQ